MSTTVQNSCELVTTIVQQGRSVSVTVVGVPGPATPGTGAGGISADVVQPIRAAGCAPADYRPGPKGRIAVTDDTGCSVGVKARAG